jgi:hypothetical protein
MATYTVTNKYLIDDFAVLQLLTPSEIAVGQSITVAGVDAAIFDGTFVVRALPQYLYIGVDTEGDLLYDYQIPIADQVLYAKVADDVERTAATGTVTYAPVCTWVTASDVMTYLGITIANPSDDYTLLTQSVSAGNQFCVSQASGIGLHRLPNDVARRRCNIGHLDVLRGAVAL